MCVLRGHLTRNHPSAFGNHPARCNFSHHFTVDICMATPTATPRISRITRLLTAWVFACALPSLLTAQATAPVSFNKDIRPLLSDRCFLCHGPDNQKREADLRLDIREAAIESGTLIPGDDVKSEIIQRILSHDPEEQMPPQKAKLPPLTQADVDILRRWIKEGAPYEGHWAFAAPVAPAVPAIAQPPAAIRNEIDNFVFADLAKAQITPSPEADRSVLIRRLSFDLTGLPPSPAEVAQFLADESPNAYEALVDRLLASPRYGERMAADWLDLSRYADSYGFQVDRERDVWPWRDWVIKAFNENLPYDQFLTWQLAGDLLPEATDEQILATTFNRLHQQEAEGGSVEEEYRVEHITDRVHTFGTAFLGLTLECSKCHDHKYDPISQKEYYQLFAFFDDVDEAGLYSYFTQSTPTPTLKLRDEAGKQRRQAAAAAVEQQETSMQTLLATRKPAFEEWLKTPTPEVILPQEVARHSFDDSPDGKQFPNLIPNGPAASNAPANTLVDGPTGKAIQFTGDDPLNLGVGNFDRAQPFSLAFRMWTPDRKSRAVVAHRSRAWTDAASRGYEVLVEDGRLKWSLIHFWPGDAISIRTKAELPLQTWLHATVTYDGSSKASGLRIYVDGKPVETEIVRDNLTKEITGGGGDNISLGERFRDSGFKGGRIDDFRVFAKCLAEPEAAEVATPGVLASLKSKPNRSPEETNALAAWYLASFDPEMIKARETLATTRRNLYKEDDGAKDIMVMREMEQPKPAFILNRGHYSEPTEPVLANVPAFLPPLPAGQPANRLTLARWLTDPQHPLTSRTAVNRFWQALFGQGLVKTAEDFGSQGEAPTHPALLDWLSVRFQQSGWDTKALLKTIVMSHTYRQASTSTPDLMTNDPENRLLARGPRHRLPAEMIRDQFLAASGLLVEKTGGPPVRPYEVAESFKPSNPDKGENLYRRSLYTFWKRTGPAPVMEAFDVPKREVCSARRDTTNTPLQALILLNGTQFVEAARVMAESLLKTHGANPKDLSHHAFLIALSRPPDARELEILQQLYQEQLTWYKAHPGEAESLLKTGDKARDPALPAAELAAAAMLCQAVLNHDAATVKR
jgi:hypothetical protein